MSSETRIPRVGETVTLHFHEAPDRDFRVTHSYGAARIMEVRDEATGREGVIAFQPSGLWWWVREIEPREPWEPDEPQKREPWRGRD